MPVSDTPVARKNRTMIREVNPPTGCDAEEAVRLLFAEMQDFGSEATLQFAVTDNPDGAPSMSNLAFCAHLRRAGIDPIMLINCRDRNRIALQSDVLGALSMGVTSFIIIPGCHQTLGPMKSARNVYDLDPVQGLNILKSMMRHQKFSNGAPIANIIPFKVGLTLNALSPDPDLGKHILKKMMATGMDFLVTSPGMEFPVLEDWRINTGLEEILKGIPVFAGLKAEDTEPAGFPQSDGQFWAGTYIHS